MTVTNATGGVVYSLTRVYGTTFVWFGVEAGADQNGNNVTYNHYMDDYNVTGPCDTSCVWIVR